jgi:hypothetical protein
MTITEELVEYAKKEVEIKQYFEPSDKCTASHVLFEQFLKGTKWGKFPKLLFYILMKEEYGLTVHKDENDDLGYKLTFKNSSNGN